MEVEEVYSPRWILRPGTIAPLLTRRSRPKPGREFCLCAPASQMRSSPTRSSWAAYPGTLPSTYSSPCSRNLDPSRLNGRRALPTRPPVPRDSPTSCTIATRRPRACSSIARSTAILTTTRFRVRSGAGTITRAWCATSKMWRLFRGPFPTPTTRPTATRPSWSRAKPSSLERCTAASLRRRCST
uniref:Uncharacterized protein n=1 Tax=Cacopsylla melanoneura TaxID=428564 RepID=A0A8D8TEK7_9HEMI